jgi:phosphoenolpyruvate-protein kinase (PTS system EI component)
MASRTPSNERSARLYAQRSKLLNQARELARTGAHADHRSILPCLESVEGFAEARDKLEDRSFKVQLDRLCALAQGRGL